MPFKDQEQKREYMKEWRRLNITAGYGKGLYLTRKQHIQNEQRLREGIIQTIEKLKPIRRKHVDIDTAIVFLELALQESPLAKIPSENMGGTIRMRTKKK